MSSSLRKDEHLIIQKSKVPFLDFTREYKDLELKLDAAYKRVMESGWYILGDEVAQFEAEFASYCDVKYAVGLGSGLDALILPLKAWGIGPGDEVIVAANTYIATLFAVTQVGAKPVIVDINADEHNIDVTKIEAAINDKTKVILPTHLYGQMADMQPILDLAKKYDLKVFEDAAQSAGAQYQGKICGGHGDAVAYSFYPTKNLSCFGDGGMFTTNDPELYDIVLHLRNNGSKTKFVYDYIGYNSRLDELQAAFLREKLPMLDQWSKRRQDLAKIYFQHLSGIDGLILPSQREDAEHVFHVFCVRVLNDRRQALMDHMKANAIGYNIHYAIPPHLQTCYKDLGYQEGDFPVTEQLQSEILSLPLFPYHSDEEIQEAARVIKGFFIDGK